MGKFFFINLIHPLSDSYLLFTYASWTNVELPGGIEFIFVSTNKMIYLLGLIHVWTNSCIHAKPLALELALMVVDDRKIRVGHILMDYGEMAEAMIDDLDHHNWRISSSVINIKCLLNLYTLNVEVIPQDWTTFADCFAAKGYSTPQLSLFHQDLDIPHWLIKICTSTGFFFYLVCFLFLATP